MPPAQIRQLLLRAAIDAGKGFFASLAATYLTGQLSLTGALIVAAIMAGLTFFTEAGAIPALISGVSNPQPTPVQISSRRREP